MKQFRAIKEQYPDAMLLFRCGDFYETYAEDAVRAAKILQITLTHRSNGGQGSGNLEMAGFPFHALDTYLPKLVRAGLRVAICDQLEDPKLTKKLVKRGVTELVTPGVSYSDTTLQSKENNFVACVHFSEGKGPQQIGAAFLDLSTGEFLVGQGTEDYVSKLLTNLKPKEVLYLRGKRERFEAAFADRYFTFELDDWMLTSEAANDRLTKQFGTANLKGFGVASMPLAVIAAGGILHYLDMTQHLQTGHIRSLSRLEEDRYVWLDTFTVRNLELFRSTASEGVGLIDIIDDTVSPMGARMLHRWLSLPLKDIRAIQNRQSVVSLLLRQGDKRDRIRLQIALMQDLERLAGKVSTGRIGPRECQALSQALKAIGQVKQDSLDSEEKSYFHLLGEQLQVLEQVSARIDRTIALNPPAQSGKTGTIADGVDDELDRLRDMEHNGRQYLLQLQQREAERTGIPSLKIAFNSVFGYYLEVRNTYRDKVPADWIRKQTLVSAERYITPELKQYEEQISHAAEQIQQIENRLYMELLLFLTDYVPDLQVNAHVIAQLDCLASFALTAANHHYVCPEMNDSLRIDIRQGRHPVIEQHLPLGEQYVPNDILLDNNSQQIIILTGPNMAGKSALLRQTALIVLMAQIGSFVPADKAEIGWVDKIFTRVGANDNISVGESTFMVEMNEAASILNNLSERSLVLFDELGRGTSTYDGISIAWSIVEYIHENRFHAKTLFATHYHELNEMERLFDRIRNFNVSVREADGKVIFLRKLVRGGSEHSFGIHVAKLAGMPASIVERANQVLKDLESNVTSDLVAKPAAKPGKGAVGAHEGMQLSFFQLDDPVLEQIRDELTRLDINNLTPLEALNKLNDIKKLVGGK